eukprot:TRINITY_DN2760_c0_g1_i2.p1 TRINITY_DN2760_c0_g1~~TRINITY_DN2760_c0_g1_i2.p1  ORF type:complete len:737 (+),score=178.18 TRINITY_DN2760_c0_g1_i2:93-2303(+)
MKNLRRKGPGVESAFDASPPWPNKQGKDPFVVEALRELRRYLKTRWGSAEKAFAALDAYRCGEVSTADLEESMNRLRIPWQEIMQGRDVDKVFQRQGGKRGLTMLDIMGEEESQSPRALEDGTARTLSAANSPRGGGSQPGSLTPRTATMAALSPRNEQVVSEQEEVKRFADWAFRGSHWARFHELFHQMDPQSLVMGHVVGRRNIELPEFQRTCRKHGFAGNVEVVYDLIRQECKFRRQEKNEELGLQEYPGISLRQLKRFQARIQHVSGLMVPMVPPDDVEGAVDLVGCMHDRLAARLEHLYGSRLRAWRLLLDKRGSGTMGYVDFAKACRSIAFQGQLKLIWKSLHREGSQEAVEFQDFAPAEAENLENFAEFLWRITGLDCEKAWRKLDVYGLGKLDLADFRYAVERLSFEGDPGLIFRGLDENLLGHIYPKDLAYVKQVSKFARNFFHSGNELLHSFIEWTKLNFDGPEGLIRELELDGRSRDISVAEFAARVDALGYQGNVLSLAARLARQDGGTYISVDSLYSRLRGGHKQKMKATGPLSLPYKQACVRDRPAFDNRVYIFSERNDELCKLQRKGFTQRIPDEKFKPPKRSPSSPSGYPSRRSPKTGRELTNFSGRRLVKDRPKPAWNDTVNIVSDCNTQRPAHMRHCFNELEDKPVKQEIMRRLRGRQTMARSASSPQTLADSSPGSDVVRRLTSKSLGMNALGAPRFGGATLEDPFDYESDPEHMGF